MESPEFQPIMNFIDRDYSVPSQSTISRRLVSEYESRLIEIREEVRRINSRVSLTCDAWSSNIFKGYMAITMHWIDQQWNMRSLLLDFKRFITPHTGGAASNILKEVIMFWGIEKRLQCITTDNASDMIEAIYKLVEKLNLDFEADYDEEEFHVRCIAHVINLGVRECFGLVKGKLENLRSMILAVRSSVKRRDLFEQLKNGHGLKQCYIPNLGCRNSLVINFSND